MSDQVIGALIVATIEGFHRRLNEIEQSVGDKLDLLAQDIAGIKTKLESVMAEMDDLVREVGEANTVMESAATLIAGLRDQIRNNLHNPAQLAALASSLDTRANALQAALADSAGGTGQPVALPPAGGTPDPNAPADQGTLPVDGSGNPVQLDASGAPIGAPRPNDPATGKPVPDKPVAGAPGSTTAADAAAQPGATSGTSPGAPEQPADGTTVAPMTTTGTGAAISTTSPAQPTDAAGNPQPPAPASRPR